jgi:hypothetical protein
MLQEWITLPLFFMSGGLAFRIKRQERGYQPGSKVLSVFVDEEALAAPAFA